MLLGSVDVEKLIDDVKSKTDSNGKTTNSAYDTSNRLLSKTPDASFHAPTVSFTYTANGLRQTMADVSGSTTYGYDTRLLSTT